MVKNNKKPKKLIVSQKLKIFENNLDTNKEEIDETLRYIFSKKFRCDSMSKNAKKIFIKNSSQFVTILDNEIISESQTTIDRYKDLILLKNRYSLKNMLSNLGVNVSVSSFGYFQDKICFVIGAEYPDMSTPQVWILKDSFLPFRWIIKTDPHDVDKTLEFRYLKWRKFEKTWYPMKIEFYSGDRLIRLVQAEKVELDPVIDEDLFNINKLKKAFVYKKNIIEKKDINSSSEVKNIKKQIEYFNKTYK